jgi:adenylate kinase
MLNVILFGAPGSGKGTQSLRVAKEFDLVHISTGDVLRKELAEGSDLGRLAKDYMAKGGLVPDGVIVDMLAKVLDSRKGSNGVIFDGFPRTLPQAESLEKILSERNTAVSVLIDLQVEDAELVTRLLERGKLSGRADDNLETIQSRLSVYHAQTAPLTDYYKDAAKYVAVHGTGSIDEIFSRIAAVLKRLL